MKLNDLATAIDGKVLAGGSRPDVEIDYAFAADLLSDVLSLAEEEDRTTLVTGMINPQVMRVSEILGIAAVIVVRGKIPPPSMVEYAEELGIPLLTTCKTMFETCGVMHADGVRPCRTKPVHDTRDCP